MPPETITKIGVLHPGSGTQQLFTALAEIGYVESRNVVIEAATPKDAWPA